MKTFGPYFRALIAVAALSVPALAVDGVNLINQSTVMASGGFPYVINQPGSYRLSSDLVVGSNAGAISITVNNVSLDLNGFAIYCTACSGSHGITSNGGNTSVFNGAVGDFGGTGGAGIGILFNGFGARVDRLNVFANGTGIYANAGLTITNSVFAYNKIGVLTDTLTLNGSQFTNNASIALVIGVAGTVTNNTFDSNGLNPVAGGAISGAMDLEGAATVTNNVITNNALSGSSAIGSVTVTGTAVIYALNTFMGNASNVQSSWNGIVSAGNNVCGGTSVSKAC